MTQWHESLVDKAIRQAQERGEFDNLPGTGKPIPGAGEPYDENWWVKGLLKRENASVLPPPLALRKECEELADRMAGERSEIRVREIVADLNDRIRAVRRVAMDGPAIPLPTVDVDPVVAAWRAAGRQPDQR
jgi:hypothetical protein